MHRSRLQVVLIDSPPDVADAELAFWRGALGTPVRAEGGGPFALLADLGDGVELVHQRLHEGAARVHLDVETDDTEAEVSRLRALGAQRLGEHDGAVHMRDPAGLVFCVVPVQSEEFATRATSWP